VPAANATADSRDPAGNGMRGRMNEMTRIVPAHPESERARITTAQFLRMCDAGVFDDDAWKIELVEGELERMPPPGNMHGLLQMRLLAQLIAIFGAERIRAEAGIQLSDSVLGCDGVLLREMTERPGVLNPAELLLVIEVAETTQRRDTEMKRAKYAAADIPFYWVVDGKRSVVHTYREPIEGDYAIIETVRFGSPLPLPGTDATITLT
jgi:Uma2 family endonuclease